MTDKES